MRSTRKHEILLPIVTSDGFCLFYDAAKKQVKALNGSGRSPEKLSIDYVRQRGVTGPRIPSHDLNSVTVPGMFTSGVGKEMPTIDIRMCRLVGGYC